MQKRYRNLFFLLTFLSFSSTAIATPIVDAYKHSWAGRALKLQREIDVDVPLNHATFIGTHNSYNSKAYQIPFVRYVDPNHLLTIYDQLELGARSIELDAHWTLTSRFSHDILLCHGQSNHLGCSMFDRPMTEGLIEVRNWLKANPHEVVLLYIERHLDRHEPRLAATLNQYLGEFIFKPNQVRSGNDTAACVSLPANALTKAYILKAGKQLLIVAKGCDGQAPYEETDKFKEIWNDFVFAGINYIPNHDFNFLDSGIDDYKPFPDCGKSTTFSPDINHLSLWRIFEDRTILSGVIHPHNKDKLEANNMEDLIRCGINWPTMDMLDAGDARLIAAIWSWAPFYPQKDHGQCAIYKNQVGIENVSCHEAVAAYTCEEEKTQTIKVIAAPGKWADGETVCQLNAGTAWHFAAPINGAEMNLLKQAMAANGLQETWINYVEDKPDHWLANAKSTQYDKS